LLLHFEEVENIEMANLRFFFIAFLLVTLLGSANIVRAFECYGINSDDPNVCSGQGTCIAPDTCACDKGWAGNICDKCYYKLRGDINQDCMVDFFDLAHLAATWLIDCIVDPNDPECVPPE